MPKRSPEGPRPYVEAFPGLDALVVERAVKAGRLLCEWVDQVGRVVGHVRICAFGEDAMVLDQRFREVGAQLPSTGTRSIEIVRHHRLNNHARPSFICKACSAQAGKLHLVWDQWKCRACPRLCFLSQRAPAHARGIQRFDYLRRRLLDGVGSYELKRDFTRAQKEYGVLERALVNFGGYEISPGVRSIIFPEWMSESRRPEVTWDSDRPASALAPPAAAPPASPPRPVTSTYAAMPLVPLFDEEDPANDGFPRACRFWSS